MNVTPSNIAAYGFRLSRHNILVRRLHSEQMTEGGIVLPDVARGAMDRELRFGRWQWAMSD